MKFFAICDELCTLDAVFVVHGIKILMNLVTTNNACAICGEHMFIIFYTMASKQSKTDNFSKFMIENFTRIYYTKSYNYVLLSKQTYQNKPSFYHVTRAK
jgi:hypothetical protein